MSYMTFENEQPWVVYRYLTHDAWWPIKDSTRWWGVSRIEATCAVCGAREVLKMKIPRVRAIPDRGPHPKRVAFLERHTHPDRGAPMSWAMPLLNPDAHPEGMDMDALAMRLTADIRDQDGPEAAP